MRKVEGLKPIFEKPVVVNSERVSPRGTSPKEPARVDASGYRLPGMDLLASPPSHRDFARDKSCSTAEILGITTGKRRTRIAISGSSVSLVQSVDQET